MDDELQPTRPPRPGATIFNAIFKGEPHLFWMKGCLVASVLGFVDRGHVLCMQLVVAPVCLVGYFPLFPKPMKGLGLPTRSNALGGFASSNALWRRPSQAMQRCAPDMD